MRFRRMPRVLVFNGTEPSTLIIVIVLCAAMVVVAYGNFHERRRGDRIEHELTAALRLHREDAARIRTNAATIADLHERIVQLEACIRDPDCATVPTAPPRTTTTTRPTRTTTTTRHRSAQTTTTTRRTTTTATSTCPNPTAPVVTVCPTVP